MVVDVVHAVAVVADALGAVAEFHVGVVGVGDAADGAFVEVALPLLDLFLGFFKIDGLGVHLVGGPVTAPVENGHQVLPEKDEVVSVTEKIYLVTNENEITIPNLINWSRREIDIYANLANIECEIEGSGYVYEQSVPVGEDITDTVTIKLKDKY